MNKLQKRLELRHINMIALGGSIGTGLFLVSGFSISVGGPGGALLAYCCMAIIVYFLMTSLAEMSSFKPSAGSFCDYSTEYVGKSFGIAMGYNYWLSWASAIAVEVLAATQIIGYWFPHINPFLLTIAFFSIIVAANLFVVKVYGEIEYGLSFVKVSAILLFIVLGFFTLFSTPHFGAHNWHIADAPFHNGITGFAAVFLFVGLSFQGSELVGVASEETKNAQTVIPKSIKMIFWRLSLFYMLSILIITLLIPFNDPKLISQDNVLTSPFTLVFQNYIGNYAGDVVNFVILIAVLSAANASLYSSSRILWYLGKSKQAPKIFSRIDRNGLPIVALFGTILVSGIFLATSLVGNKVFQYIVQISSLSGFIVWFGIALSHYKFRKSHLTKNNIDPSQLKYKSPFFPCAPLFSIVVILAVIAGQIFTVDGNRTNLSLLFITYFSVIAFAIIYGSHKLYEVFSKHKKISDGSAMIATQTEI